MKRTLFLLFCTTLVAGNLFAQRLPLIGNPKMDRAIWAIRNLYVDKVNEDKIVEEGLKAMIKELDPHSGYLTPEEVREMNEPLQGGFDGIGISFNMMSDTLYVIEVISGGPSEKVGLMAGDRILKVDGVNIAGVKTPNRDVMKRLKGPKGTKVVVTVQRRNVKTLTDFTITRDKIPIYSLDASFMLDKNTGYIRLNRFSATTADEFREAFADLKKLGMEQLILDLTSNGGGLMNAATDLADEFLPKDRTIVYTEGIHSPRQDNVATSKGGFEKGRLIVLIDEYSASASEILAGAVQDWDRGLIVGRRSYGKGLVQRPIPLPDESMLKLTIARYYTPSGRFIQKPYENQENYDRDLIDRYNRGEMSNADSIHFPDSLRTTTLINKRTIYGGGGIMPDVFVPYDSTRYNHLHKTMSYSGILNRFSMKYVDENRDKLHSAYPTIDQFVASFQPDEKMVTGLFDQAREQKVNISTADSTADKTTMLKQLKAIMARDLFRSSDYYKVMWSENEALVEALDIINDKKRYNELLTH